VVARDPPNTVYFVLEVKSRKRGRVEHLVEVCNKFAIVTNLEENAKNSVQEIT
jgi:UDP-N-acetylmuramyl pentapeptide synthase